MQKISVTLAGNGARIQGANGVSINSACEGSTSSFSASELLLAALGSCIAASLLPLFERHQLDPETLRIELLPRAAELKSGIKANIQLPPCPEAVLLRLQRAAGQCPVAQVLATLVDFNWHTG